MCRRQISIASHRKYSETIQNCVIAKVQSYLMENNLRQFQGVS